ncbi:aldehyde dehydrogenase family protein, partial [Nocardia sp. NPDC003648]
MIYGKPGSDTGIVSYAARYDNFIGGDWAAPIEGRYFDNTSPVDGEIFCAVARSTAADIDMALEAAHRATDRWAATPAAERADILTKIADRIENSIEPLAVAETWDNGKPVRETLAADLPLA